ncbi:hypothetical protein Q8F55_006788 [Vanrija albida]|uniref:RING-type domain-containing protein n=1 Tax=Vanrija albida TaxID=181172 RepID=A0ABR3PY41_9TREE
MPPQASPFWICHECGAQMRPLQVNGVPQCASCQSEFIEILDPEVNPDPRLELPHPPTRPGEYHAPPGPPPPVPERPPTGPVPAPPGDEQPGLLSTLFGAIFGGGAAAGEQPARSQDTPPPRPAPSGSNITNTDNGRTWQFNFGGGTLRFQTYNGPGYGHGTAGYGQPPPFQPWGHPFLGGQYNGAGYNGAPGNPNEGLDAFFGGFGARPPPPHRGQGGPQPDGIDLLQAIMQMMAEENGSPFAGRNGQLGDYVMTEQGFNDILERLMQATGPQGPLPASKTVIDGLPRFKLDEDTLEKSTYKDCPVCKDDYTIGEEVIRIPCGHIFHPDCLVPWLEVNGSCPVCRASLVSEEDGNQPAASSSTAPGSAASGPSEGAPVTGPGGVFNSILHRLWGQAGAASADGNPNSPSAQQGSSGAASTSAGTSTDTGATTSTSAQRPHVDRRSTSPTVGGAGEREPGTPRRASGFGPAPPSVFGSVGRPAAARAPVDLLTGDSLAAEHSAAVMSADPPSPVMTDNADPPSPVLATGALPPAELSSAIPDDYRAKHARREQEAHEREARAARERAGSEAPGGSGRTRQASISADDLD